MPDDTKLPARASNQDLQTLPFDQALEIYAPSLADALPDHIPLDRFKRVVITAVNQNPNLARADRRSLFTACVKCAHDGLYPDDREAHLEIYNTQVNNEWVKRVTYIPMIAGIRKRMRNTGEVLSATAEVVYSNDHFHYAKGEDPRIEHTPAAIDQEPGQPVGAYAIIKLKNGETIREVMSARELNLIRDSYSKSYKDRAGNVNQSSPWAKSEAEMWRKTVMRRASKQAPNGSEMEALFRRIDEAEEVLPLPPPRPRREDFTDTVSDGAPLPAASEGVERPDGQRSGGAPGGSDAVDVKAGNRADPRIYAFATADGEIHEFAHVADAAQAYRAALEAAKTVAEMEAIWENGAEMVKEMFRAGEEYHATEIMTLHADRLAAMKSPGKPAGEPKAAEAPLAGGTQISPPAPAAARRMPRNQPPADRPPEQAGSSPAPGDAPGLFETAAIPIPPGPKYPDFGLWRERFDERADQIQTVPDLAIFYGANKAEIERYESALPAQAQSFDYDRRARMLRLQVPPK